MNIYSFNIGITEFAKISVLKVRNILLVQTDKANLNINLMKSTPGASQRKYLLFT